MSLNAQDLNAVGANRSVVEGTGRYFRLTSTWTLDAEPAEIAEILVEPASITRWWPASFLRAEVLHPGSQDHSGKVVRLHSKGLLPHTFQFLLRVISVRYPECICFAVRGDFEGEATVIAQRQNGRLAVLFEWRVTIHQPLIRPLVPFARWIFVMNHRWSMRSGERALQDEVLRRRGVAVTGSELFFGSSPSFPHNIAFVRRLYQWRPSASGWND